MRSPYTQLQEHFKKIARISHALTFLEWDQLVMMPPGGNSARAETIAELSAMQHELLISPVIEDALGEFISNNHTEKEIKSVNEMRRVWKQATVIPSDLVKAKSLACSVCEHGWREQRKKNNWDDFKVNFDEVVALCRQEAMARQESEPSDLHSPYEALLDLYCTGEGTDLIDSVFQELNLKLPSLLQEILEKQGNTQTDTPGPFPIDQQLSLNKELMKTLGFNFNKGRLDTSLHPFSTGDRGDHRITSRFSETEFIQALLATAHETGHASYENGLPEEWQDLPVGQARNMSIHESQSLLFEKQLLLSKEFFNYLTPMIHRYFPTTKTISSREMWKNCTVVKPSFIRVEADEVTYPFHVLLRYEIEKDLINGAIETKDIPEIWDNKMQQYLGLSTAGEYTNGCLQDIHWPSGSFGYFPSYTLGALNSAQLFSAVISVTPNWKSTLISGDISFIVLWLKDKVWSRASFASSQEIMKDATGSTTQAQPFLEHIKLRYLQSE